MIYFNPDYKHLSKEILELIDSFNTKGDFVVFAERNSIKKFRVSNGLEINVKSFKKPHIINKIAYKYFRKSKAKRSFEFANILLKKNIGTPEPIAFKENFDVLGLNESYYVSEQLQYELTYRELVEIPDFPDHENILRQFTKFCFDLHEKQIEFKDHTPGNTLIQNNKNGTYSFYLVDLNRMNFKELTFEERMKNISKLTYKKDMIEIMADEYAKYYPKTKQEIFEKLWKYATNFGKKYDRKMRLKKKIKSLFKKS